MKHTRRHEPRRGPRAAVSLRAALALGTAALLLGAAARPVLAQAAPAPVDRSPFGGAQTRALPDEVPLPGDAPNTMLRLRDGRVLWGRLLAHWPDGVRVERLDNGGRVALTWGLLDPKQEQELRQRFGYVDAGADELMVDADRILLVGGDELVGVIVNRTPDHLFVKTATSVVQLPVMRVAASGGRTQVPALDIYTREELYLSKLEELSGALNGGGRPAAEAHRELAAHCERIFDFVHAVEHLRAAATADPSYEPEELALALRLAEPKAERQDQVDALAHADLLRARGHYDEALEELTAFGNTYPDSPLLETRGKLVKRVERAQTRALTELVVRGVLRHAEDLTREAARNLTYDQAVGYMGQQLHQDVIAATVLDAQRIRADVDEGTVQQLWAEREGGRWHKATYGPGTWILGDEARAGLEEEQENTDGTERSAEREEFEKRFKRYLDNQKLAMTSGRNQDEGQDPNAFWKEWSSAGRASWLLARYAETSGHFEVSRVRFQTCRTCGGTGVRETLNVGASMVGGSLRTLSKCEACHHVGVMRRISFR